MINIFRVIFRFQTFVEVTRQRPLRTVGAFFALLLLSAGVATAVTTWHLNAFAREVSPHIDELPTITIRNGEASADVVQPWVKRLGKEKHGDGLEFVLIVDTTGQTNGFRDDEKGLLLTRTHFIAKQDRWQKREIPLSQAQNGSWGPPEIHRLVDWTLGTLPFILAAVFFVWFGLAKLVQSFIMVLPALIARSAGGPQLGFGKLWTLGIYGLAPAVIADCVLMALPFDIPHFWLFYLAIAVVYTAVGATRVARDAAVTAVNK